MYETLRLYGSVPIIPKYANSTAKLGQYIIPADTIVHLHVAGVHHDKSYWGDNVFEFDPKRWFEDLKMADSAKLVWQEISSQQISAKSFLKAHKYEFTPFSEGSRSCLGKRFSEIEFITILSMISQKYIVAVPPGVTTETLLECEFKVTLSNKIPVELILVERS
jgi:cytochrome P450